MDLDCHSMTGQDYQCPNASICLNHSSKNSMVKVIFFLLNQRMCQLEDIKVDEQPLSELMQQLNQDLESLIINLDTFIVTDHNTFTDPNVVN